MHIALILVAIFCALGIALFFFVRADRRERDFVHHASDVDESRMAFKAAALVSISQNINSQLSLDRVLSLIVGYAGPMLKADGAFLFLPDDRADLELTAGWWKEHVFSTDDLRGIAGYSYHRAQAISFPDCDIEVAPELPGVAVPIVAYDKTTEQPRTFGVLLCTRKSGEAPFTAEDVDFLMSFADQAAIAVRNAELYENLQTANRRLQDLDQIKTEFLEIVSHDIRSPLNAFIGLIDMLLVDEKERRLPLEEREKILGQMIERAQKVALAAGESLSIAQIESGEMVIHPDSVSIEETLRNLDIRPPSRCALRIDVPENLPPLLLDGERLRQVLNNLLDNAFKYSPQGGDVTVVARLETARKPPVLIISVRDHGIGFDPDSQQTLFKKFGRIDVGRTRSIAGIGLGLYICRKIVEYHNGHIRGESEGLGHGAVFTIEIPVSNAPGDKPQPETPQ